MGVAWFGDEAAFQGFIDEHGLTFPQLSDGAGDVYARFGIAAQPATVIIDADGDVHQLFGAVDEQVLDERLTEAQA